jgi:hypothetical protein
MALAEHRGGFVAREIKAAAPSSAHLGVADIEDATADYRQIEAHAIRVRDPHLRLEARWVLRRLSPESRKIEIKALCTVANWRDLLGAMGAELANVHIGTALTTAPLLGWLEKYNTTRAVEAALRAADAFTQLASANDE